MNRTDRMYAIVESLRLVGTRGRTCAWLAARFECSTRTVKRDIAALVGSGVPIISFDGRGGGYSLAKNATLPPLAFTDAEAMAIAIALRTEPAMPYAPDGAAALTKLIGAMTREQRQMLENLAARIWMLNPTDARSPTSRVIEEALRDNVQVSIDYTDENGAQTRARLIEPMALARTQQKWSVLAWCHLRHDGRWFRMDRISKANATNIPCEERSLREVFGEPPEYAQPVGSMHGL